MKRFAVGVILSMAACNSAVAEGPGPAPSPAMSTDRLDEAAASVVVPGTFASVSALCAAQRKTATCAEDVQDLTDTKLILGAGILEVKAIAVDTEFAMETYLVTRTNEGWSAIRTPILHDDHDDPGCPSIERATRIVSAIVDQGMLVVVNEADRQWWSDKEAGNLTLTYARACTVGSACGLATVIYAKVDAQDIEHADAPMHTHLFATTFTISNSGVISPARTYDDAML